MTAVAADIGTSELSPAKGRLGTFAAFQVTNFRIYVAGQTFASIGSWMQSIAQDWLVLQLTHSSSAVGITMALQFLPMLFFGMYGGMIADRFSKRRVLMITQSISAVLTTLLAVLTISGEINVVQVDIIALLGGMVFVVDNPTRQVFVNEIVPAQYLRNAVAMNAAVFQTTRLVGPAIAGVLIGAVGCGWAFAANAACFIGPLIGLAMIRTEHLVAATVVERAPRQMRSALRYVAARPHVAWTIVLVGIVGTFGLNYPVVLTAMASRTFHGGAGLYGLFNVALAVGSVTGALIAGARSHSRMRVLVLAATVFGIAQTAAAFAPSLDLFMVALVAMGIANLAFQAMANSSVQLWIEPAYRGRVMGLYMLVFVGGTPLGGPLIGWITATGGARVGMAVCGIVPVLGAAGVAVILARTAAATAAETQPLPAAEVVGVAELAAPVPAVPAPSTPVSSGLTAAFGWTRLAMRVGWRARLRRNAGRAVGHIPVRPLGRPRPIGRRRRSGAARSGRRGPARR